MNKLIVLLIFFVYSHCFASKRIENVIVEHIDSTFQASSIDSEKAKYELLAYFKSFYGIKSEFFDLPKSISKKYKKIESDDFKPIHKGYEELKKIAEFSADFLPHLTNKLFYALLEDETYLSRNDDTEMFHYFWNFQIWSTECFKAISFIHEVDDIERYTENQELIEGIYLVMFSDKLVNHPGFREKEAVAREEGYSVEPDSTNGPERNEVDTSFTIYRATNDVETEPSFIGGIEMMTDYIGYACVYPKVEEEMAISGVVYVQFVVNKEGRLDMIQAIRGPNNGLSTEAIRVVMNMPRWAPGEQKGRVVRVRFTIPIVFRLG